MPLVSAITFGAVVLATRLLPFFRWGEAPLGYDTGFYIQNAIRLRDGLIGWSAGPFYWPWRIPLALGVEPAVIVHATLLLGQLCLALAFYVLGRALIKTLGGSAEQGQIGTATALGIFAVSLTQFLGYWWMFLRQEVAMAFLVFALAALLRRRLSLAIVLGGFGGAVHPATFLPLGVALTLVLATQCIRAIVLRRRSGTNAHEMLGDVRWTFGVGLSMLVLALLFNPFEFRGYGSWFLQHRALIASEVPPWQVPELRGFFIDFPTLLLATVVYLPFAVVGFVMVIRRIRRTWEFPALLLAAFALAALVLGSSEQIIFNRRYLLILDIALIALAIVPATHFFQWLSESPWGRRSIAGLSMGLVLNILWFAWSAEPQVTSQELEEIKGLRAVAQREPHARAMSTDAFYTPWVYGYSRLPTIAPGYLDQNRWSLEEWKEFWRGSGGASRRRELFQRYRSPIYVFVGDRGPQVRFIGDDPSFVRVSPHVWKYHEVTHAE